MNARLLYLFLASTSSCSLACRGAAHDAAASDEAVSSASGLSCDVRDYGAKGDGAAKDTAAIQAAIDACAGKGGTVHLRNGTFLSGTITLKSSMTFLVHPDATLLGSQDDADYPDLAPPTTNSQITNCKKALVYSVGAQDLHITGGGTIDGNGGLPAWNNSKEATRPMAMFILQGNDVAIDGITVKRSAMWSVVNMETDNLSISKLTVASTQGSTRDGIDIVDCHHVKIDSVDITSEDDSICLKSGIERGIDDVTITNSHVHGSGVANGLKIGTASYGPVTNVTFDTIDLAHADKAAMAIEAIDGSVIKNLTFRNITFSDAGSPFFLLVGDRGARPAGAPRLIGGIDGVTFENITGTSPRHSWGSTMSGLAKDGATYPITNVTFTNVHVMIKGGLTTVPQAPAEYAGQYPDTGLTWGNMPASGFFLRHVSNVTFTASSIDVSPADARPLFDSVDATNVTLP